MYFMSFLGAGLDLGGFCLGVYLPIFLIKMLRVYGRENINRATKNHQSDAETSYQNRV